MTTAVLPFEVRYRAETPRGAEDTYEQAERSFM